MMLTAITDDLTGAADSGSYFTERGQALRIYTSGEEEIVRRGKEIISVNLSSRNISGAEAKARHYDLVRRMNGLPGQVVMKKIGTGFRGNDPYEIEGLLEAAPERPCFIIDNAPDLGTFTLYGNQYCEGQILHKSLYAKDPIMPPTCSFIPDILAEHTGIPIGLVDIDAVKTGRSREETARQLAAGKRILVFDAVTKADTLAILQALMPDWPHAFWTGSLGIADALAEYFFGKARPAALHSRAVRTLGFCASAYPMAEKQIDVSCAAGLQLVELDMDAVIGGDTRSERYAIEKCLESIRTGNTLLRPHVEKYSYKEGTSRAIMASVGCCAEEICRKASFDRLAVIGGETAQCITARLGVRSIELTAKLEPGVAEGTLCGGVLDGKEFALKGGSVGSEQALEKMLCRWKETTA